jgi:sugar phosphate isomerase/epimerase
MSPVLGITSQIINHVKWYKYIRGLGFEAVEINRRSSKLHFNVYFLEKLRRYMEGFDVSVHSGTAGVFQPYESFTEANLAVLTAEVDVCRIIGARQLVFHLDDAILSPGNKKRLKQVITYAVDSDVQMVYESNSGLVADYAYDVLESFPELGYVLDLGHLNHGSETGKMGCEIDDFLRCVKNRVVYIHASNNYGKQDENNALDNGTLDWRHVLDMLDITRIIKIIIEVRQMDMVESSRRELMQYLGRDSTVRPSLVMGLHRLSR